MGSFGTAAKPERQQSANFHGEAYGQEIWCIGLWVIPRTACTVFGQSLLIGPHPMTDRALEAAADATIVAKAMACSEWPKWLFDLIDLTNRAADEADMSTEQAVAFAVLSYLSALPGEAEVVELVEKMRRGTPEKQVGIGRHGDRIIDVDLAATDALLLKAADALQAMQARVKELEDAFSLAQSNEERLLKAVNATDLTPEQKQFIAAHLERSRPALKGGSNG